MKTSLMGATLRLTRAKYGANGQWIAQPHIDGVVIAAYANKYGCDFLIMTDRGHVFRTQSDRTRDWQVLTLANGDDVGTTECDHCGQQKAVRGHCPSCGAGPVEGRA